MISDPTSDSRQRSLCGPLWPAVPPAAQMAVSFTWSQLPPAVTDSLPDGRAPVVATELDASPRPPRRDTVTGAYWRAAALWRATMSGITVVQLRQRLEPKRDRLAPTGELDPGVVMYYSARARPNRKDFAERAASCLSADEDLAGNQLDDLVSQLPEPVTRTLRSAGNRLVYDHTAFVQYSDQSRRPYRQKLRLIRIASSSAVVVSADRQAAAFDVRTGAGQALDYLGRMPWRTTAHEYRIGTGYTL